MTNLLQRFLDWLSGLGSPKAVVRDLPAAKAPTRVEPSPPPMPEFEPEVPLASKKIGRTSGLDAADFLPITREEIKDAAKGRRLLSNPWFGRRDLIPPADDPRTQLIDRAMVTQGLITPEQLVEIHAVGAEMDRVRPTTASIAHQAAMTGEAAVQAEKEERARIKARKKAEAAERKREHAEAVAWRKANDIVFLGRGVSGRLGERTSRAADLEQAGLPVMSTPAELARRSVFRSRGCDGWRSMPRWPRGPTTFTSPCPRRAAARGL